MRSSFSISVLYHAYVYLEFLILACTIYILAPCDVMYENQRLQEENESLRELLEKAYEFMKQFVIDGVNLLEKFLESVGKVMERLR